MSSDTDRKSLCRGTLMRDGTFKCDWIMCPVGMDDAHWEHCMLRLPDDDPPAAVEGVSDD